MFTIPAAATWATSQSSRLDLWLQWPPLWPIALSSALHSSFSAEWSHSNSTYHSIHCLPSSPCLCDALQPRGSDPGLLLWSHHPPAPTWLFPSSCTTTLSLVVPPHISTHQLFTPSGVLFTLLTHSCHTPDIWMAHTHLLLISMQMSPPPWSLPWLWYLKLHQSHSGFQSPYSAVYVPQHWTSSI